MSDSEAARPRRASEQPDDFEDTPTTISSAPRRSMTWDIVEDATTVTAKPGRAAADDATQPLSAPRGRRFSTAALPPNHNAIPRRSATSAVSPLPPFEDALVPAPARTSKKDRFGVWFLSVAVFSILMLTIAMVIQLTQPPRTVAPLPTPSPSASAAPSISPDYLLSAADIELVSTNADWYIGQTLLSLDADSPRIACSNIDRGSVKPQASLQRTLLSTKRKNLAVLHQLDSYSSANAATIAFEQQRGILANCSLTQTLLVSATRVSGLGDDALQLNVINQDETAIYHAILLVRNGDAISTFGVASAERPPNVPALVQAAATALKRVCVQSGSCPTTVTSTPTVLPKATPAGWLIEADLPRLSAGSGRWTATDPGNVISKGTGCEDISLDSFKGPVSRGQRTFLLTQDARAPQGFGLDELVFTFEDAKAAQSFAATLEEKITSCESRLSTATVSKPQAISASFGSIQAKGTQFKITQATSQDKKVLFQVAISHTANRVTYVLINATESFQLSPDQLQTISAQAAIRATQS